VAAAVVQRDLPPDHQDRSGGLRHDNEGVGSFHKPPSSRLRGIDCLALAWPLAKEEGA
jgi:hypothetical protein